MHHSTDVRRALPPAADIAVGSPGDRCRASSRADARIRHHDLRRDVGARRRRPARQPRAGLPRHRRAGGGAGGRGRGDPRRRAQPVPAGAGHPGAAPGHRRRTSSASTASHYDADTEVLVTAGATEAIAAAMLALVEPGDEVVTFEPYYDSYAACIALGGRAAPGGHPAPRRPRLTFDPAELCGRRSRRAPGWSCSTRRTTRRARSSTATNSNSIAASPSSTT